MSDPLRTDANHEHSDLTPGERDARIEQLLLAGLDYYFAAQYEQAINVWTRVLFLDRGHARARAYVDRARSALAERQRESEELLHGGIAAFNCGEPHEARRLLTAAIEQGAPPDVALALLERLNRLEGARRTEVDFFPPADPDLRPWSSRVQVAVERPVHQTFVVVALLVLIAAALSFALLRSGVDPVALVSGDRGEARAMAPAPARPDPLPVPRAAESQLARARHLRQTGHLKDALRELERVRPSDPLRTEADKLRAEIQQALLGVPILPATPAPSLSIPSRDPRNE
jgi:tetratricopeptide (TPR) repeat protein